MSLNTRIRQDLCIRAFLQSRTGWNVGKNPNLPQEGPDAETLLA